MSGSPQILRLLAKIIVFTVGAYVSILYETSYWYVGPIFGAVVLVWNTRSPRDLLRISSGLFLLASTLIYAGVWWLMDHERAWWFHNSEGYFYISIAIGTIALPIAQTVILHRPEWKRTLLAIPLIYGSWYLLASLLTSLMEHRHIESSLLINAVPIWQAAYLLFMFAPWPKRFTRAPHL